MPGVRAAERLERRVDAINFSIMACLAVASGLAASALSAAPQPDPAAASAGRLPARPPVAAVVPRPAAHPSAIPAAPAVVPAMSAAAPEASAEPVVPPQAHTCPAAGWYVQLGALRGTAHVRDLVAQGREHSFPTCTVDAHGLTLVLAGPYRDGHEAARARDRIEQALGVRGFLRRNGGR